MDYTERDSSKLSIIPRKHHKISRKSISEAALKVLYRLDKSGHRACLVGGGVRDLLLDKNPKDFDVATDATPEQVRQLFRNSRIIGRRFRLVHIRFGREIIEVATFRGHSGDSDRSGGTLFRRIYGLCADGMGGWPDRCRTRSASSAPEGRSRGREVFGLPLGDCTGVGRGGGAGRSFPPVRSRHSGG